MSIFHIHRYEEERRTFTPGRRGFKFDSASEHMLERLLYGFTTVEMECRCGKVQFEETLGDQRLSLEEQAERERRRYPLKSVSTGPGVCMDPSCFDDSDHVAH